MSGQQIGTVVGGVIGLYFGNPQLGMMIGGMIGGAIDPEVIRAPGIGDAQKQTTQAGVPRPVVYGHPAPFMGNIIDGEHKARKIIVEEGGKGGPVVESERFLLTSAIRICEGPIAGVLRVWRNGEVVYDARTDDQIPQWDGSAAGHFEWLAEMRAYSMRFKRRATFYLGTEDQLPDPALEALHGVGNTPYYRGTAYMVVVDDDVTDTRGACAQYQFEVVSAGASQDIVTVLPSSQPSSLSAHWYTSYYRNAAIDGSTFGTASAASNIVRATFRWPSSASQSAGRMALFPIYEGQTVPPDDASVPDEEVVPYLGRAVHDTGWWANTAEAATAANARMVAGGFPEQPIAVGVPPAVTLTLPARAIGMGAVAYSTNLQIMSCSLLYPIKSGDGQYTMTPDAPGLIIGSDGGLYYPSWETGETMRTITPGDITLGSVVVDIAARCGVPAAKVDATAITPDIIPGYLVANQFTGADCIRPTQQLFYFDMPEVDGELLAVKRGGAIVATIADDDMLEAGSDDDDTRAQPVEFPLKVSVVTRDPAADYSPVPQTSSRFSAGVKALGEVVVEAPIPFGADAAKQRADVLHKVLWAQAEGRSEFQLPEEWTRLVPSDCYERNGKRWMVEGIEYADGAVRVRSVYDRASNYSSNAKGVAPAPPVLPDSGIRGPTVFAALNLPPLREQDEGFTGMYLVATGTMTSWDGCSVQMSADGGATFRTVAAITRRSVMGTLAADVTASGEPITVALADGAIYSVSGEQIALGANAFAMVPATGATEIAQAQDAAEDAGGNYLLTTVTRGVKGTTPTAHVAGERFAMLANALFLPVDSSLVGQTLIFRAVTNGTVPEDNATVSIVYNPVPVEVIIDGGGA